MESSETKQSSLYSKEIAESAGLSSTPEDKVKLKEETTKDTFKTHGAELMGFIEGRAREEEEQRRQEGQASFQSSKRDVLKTLTEYQQATASGKESEPLNREQISQLAENTREYWELKQSTETSKQIINTPEFQKHILEDSEFKDVVQLVGTENAAHMIGEYLDRLIEVGDIATVKRFTEKISLLQEKIKTSGELDQNISRLAEKYNLSRTEIKAISTGSDVKEKDEKGVEQITKLDDALKKLSPKAVESLLKDDRGSDRAKSVKKWLGKKLIGEGYKGFEDLSADKKDLIYSSGELDKQLTEMTNLREDLKSILSESLDRKEFNKILTEGVLDIKSNGSAGVKNPLERQAGLIKEIDSLSDDDFDNLDIAEDGRVDQEKLNEYLGQKGIDTASVFGQLLRDLFSAMFVEISGQKKKQKEKRGQEPKKQEVRSPLTGKTAKEEVDLGQEGEKTSPEPDTTTDEQKNPKSTLTTTPQGEKI